MFKFLGLSLPIVIFAIGCASSSPGNELSKVRAGMSKQEVLGIAGNPSRSGRSNGADRWSYDIKDKSNRKVDTIDVYFSSGKVQYVGSEKSFEDQIKNQKPHSKDSDTDVGFKEL